ncbi:unnamed protein product [Boreogadus saida]
MGKQTNRQGLDGRQDSQTGRGQQREGRLVDREPGTEEQTDQQGLGSRQDSQTGRDRQRGGRQVDQEPGTEKQTDRQGLGGRSYIVETAKGECYRRNRRHLQSTPVSESSDQVTPEVTDTDTGDTQGVGTQYTPTRPQGTEIITRSGRVSKPPVKLNW